MRMALSECDIFTVIYVSTVVAVLQDFLSSRRACLFVSSYARFEDVRVCLCVCMCVCVRACLSAWLPVYLLLLSI